jgi:hypothetical protein
MSRLCIAFLGLVTYIVPAAAQQTGSAAPPSSDQALQQLRAEVQRLASTLESTRSELQACRNEIHQLRTELQNSKEPAVANQDTIEAVDTAHALADLREDEKLLDAHVGQLYQTKVESGSKYRVRLSGLMLFNTFMNHGTVETISVPNLALPTPAGQPNGNIGATFRQTLFTLQTFGPEVAGARTSGEVQLDFYGGYARTLDGYVLGIARLRTANLQFDWKDWSLRFTQDKPFISPLSPTTIAAIGTPEFAYSGDLWTWTPQIIGERTWQLSENVKPHLQFGLLDPFDGEYPQTFFVRPPEAGELSRTPGLAARNSWDFPLGKQIVTIGAGGYFARQDYGFGRVVDAWAATLDWNVPFGERWLLSGELHRGRALGGMWGGIGTSVVFNRPENDPYTDVIGVNTVGGWSQLKFKPATKWELNGAFGEESPFAADLQQNASPNYQPVLRNWTTMVNVIDRPRSNLILSLEYRHLNTVLWGGQTHTAEHVNVGVGVAF